MRKLLLILALLPFATFADQRTTLEYGRAATVDFEMYDTDGTLDVDEVDGGAEVTIHCNGDAGTTATADFVDEGNFYSIALTAAELECRRVSLSIAAALNHMVFIETCGSPNAQHMQCAGGAYITGGTSASASNTTTTTVLDTSLSFADDDLNGYLICQVEDQAAGDPIQCKPITDYTNASDTATHQAFIAALPQNGEYLVLPEPSVVLNVTNGVIDANTTLIEGADATDTLDAASVNVASISGDTVAADNLESYTDGTDRQPVDVKEINSTAVTGTGTAGDKWTGN